MIPLTIYKPNTITEATGAHANRSVFKAGGLDVLDHLKQELIEADALLNLRSIDDTKLYKCDADRIGALVRVADIASNREVQNAAPVIAQAAASIGTPQVRNVATLGGNLLQRPRCWYYRQSQFDCLKKGGHTCFAFDGENKYHAIFGDGPCHIVHPSTLAIAFAVCDTSVTAEYMDDSNVIQRREISIDDLYTMPSVNLHTEHVLRINEVMTDVRYTAEPISAFYEVRERKSFDWPLVMVAVSLRLDGRKIMNARVCAGAVAPVPWRLVHVEKALKGIMIDDADRLENACKVATKGSKPLRDNAYKRQLLKIASLRAIYKAASGVHQ